VDGGVTNIDAGATAWVMASAALVLLMTPGLAFFYGGMVRAKNVLAIVAQNFAVIAVVSVLWVTVGFTIAFGDGGAFLGDLHNVGLLNLNERLPGFDGSDALRIPAIAFVAFQMMLAFLTPAIVTGSTADRWRFGAFLAFVAVWAVVVYAPVAHWVFSPVGWAAELGVQDYAGGTVVQVNAGAAALVIAYLLGRRQGWLSNPMRPHNLPLVMIGAGLLWFGWIGLNAGAGLRADTAAATAVVNTQVAASGALIAWMAVEWIRFRKATSLGAASGAVCGLVAITPAAGYVSPLSAVIMGLVAGGLCSLAVGLKTWVNLDDSLDVVAVHLGGGVIGTLSVGLFSSSAINPDAADGVFYGGGYRLLGVQALTVLAVLVYSAVATLIIGALIRRLVGIRVTERQEEVGLDLAQHGETAYEFTEDSDAAEEEEPAAEEPASPFGYPPAGLPATRMPGLPPGLPAGGPAYQPTGPGAAPYGAPAAIGPGTPAAPRSPVQTGPPPVMRYGGGPASGPPAGMPPQMPPQMPQGMPHGPGPEPTGPPGEPAYEQQYGQQYEQYEQQHAPAPDPNEPRATVWPDTQRPQEVGPR
jgi:Amt family ammonium transporter